MSNLNKPQKIFMSILYTLTTISLIVSCFVIYNISYKRKPWTLGVTYASTLEVDENLTVPIVRISIHENATNDGQSLYEVLFNSYTDSEGNGIAGFGIQCLGNYEMYNAFEKDYKSLVEWNNSKATGNMNRTTWRGQFSTYYTGDQGITYSAIDQSKMDDYLLISIKSNFYRLKLKTYKYKEIEQKPFWDAFLSYITFRSEYREVEKQTQFTWYDVFNQLISSALYNSGKSQFSEYSLCLLDLSTYLTIEYKDSRGQYHELNETSEQRNYLSCPVIYIKNGARSVSDSMFSMVNNSITWNLDNNVQVQDYWNAYSLVVLNESHFTYRFSNKLNAYVITCDDDFSNYLKYLNRSEIYISIDLANVDKIVRGIDLSNFDFNINDISIYNVEYDNFQVYNIGDVVPKIIHGGSND